jgi:hypothetical protein
MVRGQQAHHSLDLESALQIRLSWDRSTRREKHPPPATARQSPCIKIFHFTEIRICGTHPPIPVQGEGRSSVVTKRGSGCGGRGSVGHAKVGSGRDEPREILAACGRTAPMRTAKSCGPGRRCYGQALRRWIGALPGLEASPIRKATVTKRNSSPGRARHKPSTHCAGKAECSATPVCCCAVFLRVLSRSGPRVPAGTRSSLRSLHRGGLRKTAKLGHLMPREGRFMRDLSKGNGAARQD